MAPILKEISTNDHKIWQRVWIIKMIPYTPGIPKYKDDLWGPFLYIYE
jgi:hypothetical protein